MYYAKEECIYVINPDDGDEHELFITVHATRDCTKTPAEQAVIIAKILNGVT